MKLFSALAFALVISLPASVALAGPVPDAPDNLNGQEAYQDKTFHFMVRGASEGHVWGTDIYTLDSSLAAAAVHAGIVKPGEKKEAVVLMMPGRASYHGSARHGVTSDDYGAYPTSYRFLKPGEAEPTSNDGKHPLETTDNVMAFKPRVGEVLLFKVTGSAEGTLWGSGVYTGDSNLAAAAVHAGMVKPGETASLRVALLPGQEHYQGSQSNGVTSGDYESYDLSFRFEKPVDASASGEASKPQSDDKNTSR